MKHHGNIEQMDDEILTTCLKNADYKSVVDDWEEVDCEDCLKRSPKRREYYNPEVLMCRKCTKDACHPSVCSRVTSMMRSTKSITFGRAKKEKSE